MSHHTIDDQPMSYATASSALMVSGRYTLAPNADLVSEDDTAILHPHFCALYTHFLSLAHNGTAGSIAPYPRWLCVVLNKAFCSRRGHCIEFCTSYRWGTEWEERGIQILGTHRGTNRRAGGPGKCHIYTPNSTTAELTWSNCASSPLWRDRDRGFSCKMRERERNVCDKPNRSAFGHLQINAIQATNLTNMKVPLFYCGS